MISEIIISSILLFVLIVAFICTRNLFTIKKVWDELIVKFCTEYEALYNKHKTIIKEYNTNIENSNKLVKDINTLKLQSVEFKDIIKQLNEAIKNTKDNKKEVSDELNKLRLLIKVLEDSAKSIKLTTVTLENKTNKKAK